MWPSKIYISPQSSVFCSGGARDLQCWREYFMNALNHPPAGPCLELLTDSLGTIDDPTVSSDAPTLQRLCRNCVTVVPLVQMTYLQSCSNVQLDQSAKPSINSSSRSDPQVVCRQSGRPALYWLYTKKRVLIMSVPVTGPSLTYWFLARFLPMSCLPGYNHSWFLSMVHNNRALPQVSPQYMLTWLSGSCQKFIVNLITNFMWPVSI